MTIGSQFFWQDFIMPSLLYDILFGHNFDKVQSNIVWQTSVVRGLSLSLYEYYISPNSSSWSLE